MPMCRYASSAWRTAIPVDIRTSPLTIKLIRIRALNFVQAQFAKSGGNDPLAKARAEVDQVKGIMVQNIGLLRMRPVRNQRREGAGAW